jgi:hypothetical protein
MSDLLDLSQFNETYLLALLCIVGAALFMAWALK